MTEAVEKLGTSLRVKMTVRAFTSGVIVVALVSFACIVATVIASVFLLVPLIHYRELINKVLHADNPVKTQLTDASMLTVAIVLFVLLVLIFDEPLRICLWGARAFARYDHRASLCFVGFWICWRVLFNWTGLFGWIDDAILVAAFIYVAVSYVVSLRAGERKPPQ